MQKTKQKSLMALLSLLVLGLLIIFALSLLKSKSARIDNYSLSGPVTKAADSEILIQVSKVEGKQLVFEEKKITVSGDTRFIIMSSQNSFAPKEAQLSDITTSSNIVVYTKDNPAKFLRIQAERIEIIK